MNSFFKDVGIVGHMPVLNGRDQPSWKNKMYRDFYNINTKNIIKKKFREDLDYFRYDF